MSWIFIAVIAQILLAVVALTDKYIVSDEKILPRPFVYAFYTSLLSGVWIIIYFFGLIPWFDNFPIPSFASIERPTLEIVALSFLAAYTFFMALVSMFTAFKQTDASDVVPVVGSVSAIATFGLGYLFLGSTLAPNFIWGIALLAIGTLLVSRLRFPPKVAWLAVHSGLFFALHYVSIKGLFNITSFDNGFFWSRIAFMGFALSLLLVPTYYEKIAKQTKNTTKKARVLILSNKFLAGVSTLLILKATDLGDPAVVQALGGLQFVFLLLLGIIFVRFAPKSCGEESCRENSVIQKSIFVAIITLGFLVLFM